MVRSSLSSERTVRSDDIVRLRQQGLEVLIRDGHLIVGHVPYRAAGGVVAYGVLVSILEVRPTGETVRPSDHRVWFGGALPCDHAGSHITFTFESRSFEIIPGIQVDFGFSLKPDGGQYSDYCHKMTYYLDILRAAAMTVDPEATAVTHRVLEAVDDTSPFVYEDTASSRAGTQAISAKLRLEKVAVVGLGGTGSYILDQLAKCPINEIHLFDGDVFEQHNAFRAPGAASIDELALVPFKVDYFANLYLQMHRRVIPHPYWMDESHVDELREMSFVFLSIGDGRIRKALVDRLEQFDVDFIDVGLSVTEVEAALSGMVRITTSLRGHREEARKLLTFSDGEADDLYARNIQLASLNCLNAALAVCRFQRRCGFLIDQEHEVESLYVSVGNAIVNQIGAA